MGKFKTYILNKETARYALQLAVGGKSEFIQFTSVGFGTAYASGKPTYSTSDEKIQKAIEDSKRFKEGLIQLRQEVDDGGEKKGGEPAKGAVYPDVTTFNQAIEVLTSDPHNLPKTGSALNSPQKIRDKAAELGILFPNLPTEE